MRPTTVSEWKTRKREPSAVFYAKIAEYFGVSLDYLITGRPPRDAPVQQIIGNNISVSGKDLETSQASKTFECGTKNPINKGYELFWGVTDNLYKSIGNDLNFDLTQIKDTVTFTVEFNDEKTQTASLNLYFDSDGYMHIG